MIRILLFGDNFGVPQLIRHIPFGNIIGVVGAGIRPQYHAELKKLAMDLKLPFVIQPKWGSAFYYNFKDVVKDLKPDLILSNSYAMIIRDDILNSSRFGGLNIHGALLPKNRGCNPTQWAILNGDRETGVTLHEMSSCIDEGAIIDQRRVPILFEDTWLDIKNRLVIATDDLIRSNVQNILSGSWNSTVQSEQHATVGRRRTPDDGLFKWDESVVSIYNKIRALLPPNPPAFYIESNGCRQVIDKYHTIWQLTVLKYKFLTVRQLCDDRLRLHPLGESDGFLMHETATKNTLTALSSQLKSDYGCRVEKLIRKRNDLVVFIIQEIESGQINGTCQIINIDWSDKKAELSINLIIADKSWILKAVKFLTEFGFTELNLSRLYIRVSASSFAKIAMYEECGFKIEEMIKKSVDFESESMSEHVMSILRCE